MRKTFGVVFALVALALPRATFAQKIPLIDLPWERPGQYVENVSEEGYGAIYSTASLLSGATLAEFKLTPERGIFHGYMQSPCFLAFGGDEERAKNRVCRGLIEARKQAWLVFLTAHADRDGSGFVTTEEATAIYEQVQTAFHVSRLHIATPEGLLRLTNYRRLTKAAVLARLASYSALREAALKENLLGLPALPVPLLRATEATVA